MAEFLGMRPIFIIPLLVCLVRSGEAQITPLSVTGNVTNGVPATGTGLVKSANGIFSLAAAGSDYQKPSVILASDFGAVQDYSTDDTTAIQSAINAVCGANSNYGYRAQVVINNSRIAGTLSFGACSNYFPTLHIKNRVSLGTPLVIPVAVALEGEGSNGVQFLQAPVANVTCDASATYSALKGCLFISGSGPHSISNISVSGSDGAQIYGLPGTQLVQMRNVGAISNRVSTSAALLLDGVEWLECEHCAFITLPGGNPYSARLTASSVQLGGLIKFTDTVFSGAGIQIDSQIVIGNGPFQIELNNVIQENVANALLNLDATNVPIRGLSLKNVNTADAFSTYLTSSIDAATTTIPVGDGTGYEFPLPVLIGTEQAYCTAFTATSGSAGNLTCSRGQNGTISTAHGSYAGVTANPSLIHVIADPHQHISNIHIEIPSGFFSQAPVVDAPISGLLITGDGGFVGPTDDRISTNQRSWVKIGNGMVDADLVSNGSTPVFPTVYASKAVNQNSSAWTTQSGGTLTAGVRDPFGGTKAATLTANTCSDQPYINVFSSYNDRTMQAGDWVIAGLWERSESSNPPKAQGLGISGTGSLFDNQSSQLPITNSAAMHAGGQQWERITSVGKVAVAGTTPGYNLFLGVDCTHPTSFYKPWIVIIPAGTVSDEEAIRYARSLGGYPSGMSAATDPRLSMHPETSLTWGNDTAITRLSAGVLQMPSMATPGIKSGTVSNTDLAGELSFSSATTASYTFTGIYTGHPECTLTPQFNAAGNGPFITYTGVASFTINFATAVTGNVSYTCVGRN